jgi:hypothetical protein
LWVCPRCGKAFVNRNSSHSCTVVPVDAHFEGRPGARALWQCLVAALSAMGPLTIVSNRTNLGFMTRVRFAGCRARRDRVRVGFWLLRPVDSPRIARREFIPPGNWVHDVDVRACSDLDEELLGWLREARAIGDQEHHAWPRRHANRVLLLSSAREVELRERVRLLRHDLLAVEVRAAWPLPGDLDVACVVVDLDHPPEGVAWAASTSAGGDDRPPMVLAGGADEVAAAARPKGPGATTTTWGRVGSAVRAAISARPPIDLDRPAAPAPDRP